MRWRNIRKLYEKKLKNKLGTISVCFLTSEKRIEIFLQDNYCKDSQQFNLFDD